MSEQQQPAAQQRIAEIRARVEAAMPGPWEVAEYEGQCQVYASIKHGRHLNIHPIADAGPADAALIASARDDVPWLLDQLAAALDALRYLHDTPIDPCYIDAYREAKYRAAQLLKEHGA